MSKRLFILSSLLETHPRRATTEARMRTPVVIKAKIRAEGGRAPRRAPIRHAIRPFAQQGLDEALRFAVGLRSIGTRETMAHAPASTHGRKRVRAIDHRIVGEQPANVNTAATKPGERPMEKRGGRRRIIGRE